MLQAFLDESGIHDQASLCVLAGFIGSAKQWKRFEESYATTGPDAITPGFHAKRLFAATPSRVSPYKDWSDQRAQSLVVGLLNAIAKTDIHPFGAMLDVTAFREYSLEERRLLTGGHREGKTVHLTGSPDKPYYVLFQSAIVEGLRRMKRPDWKLHFAFDQQNVLAPFALSLYEYMRNDPKMEDWSPRMGDISFKARLEAPALQAADLLSYCWYQVILHGRNGVDKIVATVLDVPAAHKKDYELHFFSKQTMDRLLGRAPLRSGVTFHV